MNNNNNLKYIVIQYFAIFNLLIPNEHPNFDKPKISLPAQFISLCKIFIPPTSFDRIKISIGSVLKSQSYSQKCQMVFY